MRDCDDGVPGPGPELWVGDQEGDEDRQDEEDGAQDVDGERLGQHLVGVRGTLFSVQSGGGIRVR